jgi:hypothetical protein
LHNIVILLGKFFCQSQLSFSGTQLQEYYKEHLSDFRSWDQLSHCEQYILFPESMDSERSILRIHDFFKNIPNIPNQFQQSPMNRDSKGLGIGLGIVLECEGLKKLFFT